MNDTERYDVHKLHLDLLRLKSDGLADCKDAVLRGYAALVLALRKRKHALTQGERKEQMTEAQQEQLRKMRLDAVAKKRTKGEGKIRKLIRLRWYHDIENLLEEGLSWRQISDYIAKHHKRRVSHTYLKKVFEELKSRESS
jgi:type II secretory pathway component PulF